MRYYLMCSKIQ